MSADGTGLVSQANAVLLAEAARITGLGAGLSSGLARDAFISYLEENRREALQIVDAISREGIKVFSTRYPAWKALARSRMVLRLASRGEWGLELQVSKPKRR